MKTQFFIKIALTFLFSVFLIKIVNIRELFDALQSVNIYYLILSGFCIPILYVIRTYRWNVLLRSLGINRTFVELFEVILIGVFYGLVTPGRVGEFARAYYLDERKSVTISTILMEKLIDVLILAFLSIITAIFFFNKYSILNSIILVACLASILSLYLFASKKLTTLLTKPLRLKIEDVETHIDSFSKLRNNWSAMLKTISLAFLYYIICYLVAIVILYSLGTNAFAVITLPLIVLMGNLPITVSGLGVRESIGVACFILLGESGAQGLLFSTFLFIMITLIPGIFGYLLTILDKNRFASIQDSGV
jgi:uncharacterized protein (TIRG00374 family)